MIQQTVFAEPSILKDMQTYNQHFITLKDSLHKISFKYPIDWVKTTEECPTNDCEMVASFALPKENYSDMAVVKINGHFLFPRGNESARDQLANYVFGYLASLRWLGLNDLSMSSGNITTVGGNPAWKITLPDNEGMTSSMLILAINNRSNSSSIGYNIEYVASQGEQYLKHLMTVQKMINSIKFTHS